jgi:protein gp37
MASTDIEWCDCVWNVCVGCNHVSAGCENCYAARIAHRGMTPNHRGLTVMTKHGTRWNGQVRCSPEMLDRPLHWRKPRTVFVNSMSDLFHEKVPFEFIAAVFGMMAACPRHQFVVLTKRDPRPWFEWIHQCRGMKAGTELLECQFQAIDKAYDSETELPTITRGSVWPLPNVAIGVSCENQEQAEIRLRWLTLRLAAIQFASLEPLLSNIDLTLLLQAQSATAKAFIDPNAWRKSIDGVILGCESGPRARLMDEDWARSIRDQCVAAGCGYFLKQLKRDGKIVSMPELDGRVWDQLPWRRNA